MGQSHSQIKAKVVEALTQRGWPNWSYPSSGYTGPSVSDNFAVVPPEGWTVAIEVKTPYDKPVATDFRWIRQQRFLRQVADAGGISVWGFTVREILEKIDAEIARRRA